MNRFHTFPQIVRICWERGSIQTEGDYSRKAIITGIRLNWWWLRSPGNNQNNAANVNNDGSVNTNDNNVNNENEAVRPVVVLRILSNVPRGQVPWHAQLAAIFVRCLFPEGKTSVGRSILLNINLKLLDAAP